ncbi:MAG TPA: hypothetical protein VHZ27_16810 [Solirubrobacteraceae bacterium]|jgi:hypothetical protein|nr:hypothetical protein [Solirubrobacteraceae bacterium]
MSEDPRNTPPPPDEHDPHHELNNPATDPDPTEWPDPYDKRPDPRDPAGGGDEPLGDDSHTPTGSTSTSEPHHDQDLVAQPSEEERKRDKLDG